MKAILSLILFAVVFLSAPDTYAQFRIREAKTPKWISEKGFWQIQSNVQTPAKNIIYFYNNDKLLIYKESLNGVILDLKKRRIKMRLKRILETAVVAWEKSHLSETGIDKDISDPATNLPQDHR